ncbi:hypothetical protein CALCODRAFT_511751 [Calocera cornea HHB12733]|uniref:Zn(2)-C6 fungal-type domain-containing protein n=1 Tax=Calocera cornea HHB12733 TaxID=1353952 RepID=A0A165DJ68_9BASI|nr:hypothetical protein CALCODRAFT_511751 [Calocera cornea HHB12733]
MARSRYPRKAQADAAAKLTAMRERGELNDTPSPTSSVSSLSTSSRKIRSSAVNNKIKKKVAGQRPRADNGRAKTGCWTCRVRRKKCGGRLGHQDPNCIDCTRLGIECLGWGEKRPPWLRKPGAVIATRQAIKRDLTARKLVKGHKKEEEDIKPKMSPRSPPSLHTPPMLTLNDEELDLSDDDALSELDLDDEPPSSSPPSSQLSEVESPPMDDDVPEPEMPEPGTPVLVQDDDSISPLTLRGTDSEILPEGFMSVVDMNVHAWYTNGYGSLYPDQAPAMSFDQATQVPQLAPLLTQSFTDTSSFIDYNMPFDGIGPDITFDQELPPVVSSSMDGMESLFNSMHTMEGSPATPCSLASPWVAPEVMGPAGPSSPFYPDFLSAHLPPSPAPTAASSIFFRSEPCHRFAPRDFALFQDYLNHVLPLQHVLRPNQHKREVMFELANRWAQGCESAAPPPTMLCLALVHKLQRATRDRSLPPHMVQNIYRDRNKYWCMAKEALFSDPLLSHERAALAVQMLDCSLLTGCQPEIDYFRYMSVLHAYCTQITHGSENVYSLLSMMGSDQLVDYTVKTAFWMDVIGAISKRTQPRFMQQFRQLSQRVPGQPQPLDMSDFTGCDTDVMIAFAEIANLEDYKAMRGPYISSQELCQRGFFINDQIDRAQRASLATPPTMLFPHAVNEQHNPFSAGWPVPPNNFIPTPAQQYHAQILETPDARQRRRISDAFRAASRAYVWAVVNGWKPRVPEILAAVHDTIAALRDISSTSQNPVDRALILPLFLAGVLTDDINHHLFIRGRLSNVPDRECGTYCKLLEVLEKVWHLRRMNGGQEVDFRAVMMDVNTAVVLLA